MNEGEKKQYYRYQEPDLPSVRLWSVENLREAATTLGKSFNPADEIKDRLESDLAAGALVLFTQEDVINAITRGLLPRELETDLLELVVDKNDTAIIPAETIKSWERLENMGVMPRRSGPALPFGH